VAAAFLRGEKERKEFGSYNKIKDFFNKHLAEPWQLIVTPKTQEEILAARCDLPAHVIPEAAIVLTCGIDVQKNGFWFVVRAWALPESDKTDATSWLIHYGFIATWEEVEKVLFETNYPVDNSERTMRISRVCIDTGGGEKYKNMTMTDETYLWILKNRGRRGVSIWGTKGSSKPVADNIELGKKDIMITSTGRKLPGALRVLLIDTHAMKDKYHCRLGQAIDTDTRMLPGSGFLHFNTGADYAAQIVAEKKELNEKGHEEWTNPHQRPNHLLDAEIIAAACVEFKFPGGGLRLLAGRSANETGTKRRIISKGVEK
jgi:phage terminase large subunit GpA-like protein